MAIFEGTIQEFHHFLGPRIRNAINNFTRTYRNQRKGICEGCKQKKELHSAHVQGQGRRSIIEEVLSSSLVDKKIRCDIGDIEKKIMDTHRPIEKNFKFLCHTCHVLYDSNSTKPSSKSSKQLEVSPVEFRKLHRIELWANRPHQTNHKIIKAYLQLEKGGAVRLDDLKRFCSNKSISEYYVEKFDGHYASMKTDSGKSHGKVFCDTKGLVSIYPRVREEIKIHFESHG